jgi:hypothetical protein
MNIREEAIVGRCFGLVRFRTLESLWQLQIRLYCSNPGINVQKGQNSNEAKKEFDAFSP